MGSCRRIQRLVSRRLLPVSALDNLNVRLELTENVSRRVPVLAVDVAESVAVQTCLLSEAAGSNAPLFHSRADAIDEVCDHASTESILRYATQELFSYRDVFLRRYSRRMDRTPDEKREILRAFIAERGLKIAHQRGRSGTAVAHSHLGLRLG
jgi:hypothetical protein